LAPYTWKQSTDASKAPPANRALARILLAVAFGSNGCLFACMSRVAWSLKTQQHDRRSKKPRTASANRGHRKTPSSSSEQTKVEHSALQSWQRTHSMRLAARDEDAPGLHGEFDPGSGRTLAARLTHASRATTYPLADTESGERVSNTWVTCPRHRDSPGKPGLIPNSLIDLRVDEKR
jgi:hypothetical protein